MVLTPEPDDIGPPAADSGLSLGVGSAAPASVALLARSSRRLLSGAAWGALGQAAPTLSAVVLTPFLLDHLGLPRYGLYVLTVSVVGYLRTFDGGLTSTATRYFALYAGRDLRSETTRLLTSLLAVVVVVGAAVAGLVAVSAPLLVRAFRVPTEFRDEGTFLFRLLGAVVVLGVLSGLMTAVLAARQRFALPNIVTTVGTVASLALTLRLIGAGGGLRSLGLIVAVQAGVTLLILGVAAARWLEPAAARPASRGELRAFFAMSGRVQIVGLASLVTLETDSVLVGLVRGPRSVGIYSIGATVAAHLRALVLNGLIPVGAQLGRAFGEKGHAAREQFEFLQRVWVIAVTGWGAVTLGAAWVAVTAWLGPDYDVTGTIATVLVLSNTVNLWTGVTTTWLQITGHAGVEARYALVGIGVNVALTAALIAPLGLIGIMIGTAFGQVVGTAYLLRLIRRRVPDPVRSFLAEVPVVAGLTALLVTLAAELAARPALPRGAGGLVCSGLLMLPGLAAFVALQRDQLREIMELLRGGSTPLGAG